MSPKDLQVASTWRCVCGRQVPARMGECHCGITRAQALQAAKADQPEPRKPLTLLGLSLRLGAAAAVIVVGVAVYLVYFGPAPPPIAASPRITLAAPPTPAPVVSVTPVDTMPPWSGGAPNWDPPPPPMTVETPEPTEPHQPPETTPPEQPSELEALRAKTEMWRARYRPVAERVAALEKEIRVLEADVLRAGSVPFEDNNPGKNEETRRRTEFFKERLAAAREQLAAAQQTLSQIEEGARNDGVPAGQLY